MLLAGIMKDGIVSHGVLCSLLTVQLKLEVSLSIIGKVNGYDFGMKELLPGAAIPPMFGHFHPEPNQ